MTCVNEPSRRMFEPNNVLHFDSASKYLKCLKWSGSPSDRSWAKGLGWPCHLLDWVIFDISFLMMLAQNKQNVYRKHKCVHRCSIFSRASGLLFFLSYCDYFAIELHSCLRGMLKNILLKEGKKTRKISSACTLQNLELMTDVLEIYLRKDWSDIMTLARNNFSRVKEISPKISVLDKKMQTNIFWWKYVY